MVNVQMPPLPSLTQLHVLVVCHDQDYVGPDIATVSLKAGLQTLASGAVGRAEGQDEEQEVQESARHGQEVLRQPISVFRAGVSQSAENTIKFWI